MALATGADDEFADAVSGIGHAAGILRGESLVIVIVAVDDDCSVRGIEIIPERLHFRIVPVFRA